jgi:hypothetical protein
VKGILGPEDIAREIAADRTAFVERAQALRVAAKKALAAIDARMSYSCSKQAPLSTTPASLVM